MYRKLLIPTDGSSLADVAALAGVRLAREVGAAVVGLAVLPVPRHTVTGAALASQDDRGGAERAVLDRAVHRNLRTVAEATATAGVPYEALSVVADDVATQIVAAARRTGCDLIFMGSHGRTGLSRLVHGSVTAAVLAASDVPVTIYRATPAEVARHANGLDEDVPRVVPG